MHILNRHKKAINGAKVLLLGVSYKNDIDDYRESPAIRVYKELLKVGAEVSYFDPWVPSSKNMYGVSAESLPELTPEVVRGFDLVMVTAAHHNVDYAMVQKNAASDGWVPLVLITHEAPEQAVQQALRQLDLAVCRVESLLRVEG